MYYNFKAKFNFHTFFFYFFVCLLFFYFSVCFLRSELLFWGWAWQARCGQVSVLPSEKEKKACCLLLPPTWVSGTCKAQRSCQGLGAMEQERVAPAGLPWSARTAQAVSWARTGAEAPWERRAGRQHPRVRGPQASGGGGGAGLTVSRGLQDPSHTWPACQRAGQW